jgi:hypothetical protein
MSSNLILKDKTLKKLLIKNLKKKIGLKSNMKKHEEDEIQKKIIANKKKISIKKIRIKFERLKNHRGVKLKIICNMIDFL